jgi:2-succinyl-5-enolpyruvyl-6-hydroxy-3-cyclohexene-1-carboxylate synthase
MVYSDKDTATMLAHGLKAYGVEHIFSSPGSRNAPLIMALARETELKVTPVIDERQAAFIALGYASISQQPVAIVCTSGTALLNYAPAVAEAYYRKVPLIVVSADRPAKWIGQDDSQTLHQPGALANIVKATYNLKGEIANEQEAWQVNRELNETFQTALNGRRGPVHINISLAEPLTIDSDSDFVLDVNPSRLPAPKFRKIELLKPEPKLAVEDAKQLAAFAHGKRVMIVGGFCPPSGEIGKAFGTLTRLPGVVVVADALANLNAPRVISRPDLVMPMEILNDPEAKPDLLITFGGALLSRQLKEYLRRTDFAEHWHIGENEMLIDSYFSLTRRIEISEENFFPRFANAMAYVEESFLTTGPTPYKALWLRAYSEAKAAETAKIKAEQWSEKVAVCYVLEALPPSWNLQLSNGLTPRYAVVGDAEKFHRRDCNRGVSGIDGSVSTALGASLVYGPTVLLTGDMSLEYDLSALASPLVTPNLKIVVINNNGGGIFRKISATRAIPELEKYIACSHGRRFAEIAETLGWNVYTADSRESLMAVLPKFTTNTSHPTLLEIQIPSNCK